MMKKCRGRMVQRDYIMGNIFHKEGIEKIKKGNCSNQGCIGTLFNKFILALVSLDINI